MEKTIMETLEKASNFADETVDKIASITSHAVEAIDERGEKLKHSEQVLMKNCQGFIRDNPVTSLGIAAAAGFLLSRLLSGR
jgi:ElaB/YqjD/DUF883 family membrane-anchored ribosome-binding protein